jgi:hypothetical protein
MSQAEPDRDPFFIGWLPMPRRYARFLVPVALALVAAAGVAGVILARGQRSPGPGTWADDVTTFTGVVYAEPYAMIRVPGEGGTPLTLLLVNEGKFGAKDRVRALDGKPARVGGTLLARDGRGMLELADGDAGLQPAELAEADRAALRRPEPRQLGTVTLGGEIVDSKCYLGAMKPGGGRTHKACAVLCLRGGIPPLFAGRDGTLRLLVDAGGGPLHPAHCDRAADPIELTGAAEEWGDLPVLRVAAPG